MKIQSLSIHVPNPKCVNNCRFCVSQMRNNEYDNLIQKGDDKEFYKREYMNRLNFARDNDCNTLMLTGTSEPQQNRKFIEYLTEMNKELDKPFRNMELQTTGVLLDEEYLKFFRYETEVKTISFSISDPFDDDNNADIINMPSKAKVNLKELAKMTKDMGFNVRLSLNLTNVYDYLLVDGKVDEKKLENMFKYFNEELYADQLTFRKFYTSGTNSPQDKWILENKANDEVIKGIEKYIVEKGRVLEKLEYGALRYSVYGMSTVVDEDCMSSMGIEEIRYLILRPNCHLYTKWNDNGSLLY